MVFAKAICLSITTLIKGHVGHQHALRTGIKIFMTHSIKRNNLNLLALYKDFEKFVDL